MLKKHAFSLTACLTCAMARTEWAEAAEEVKEGLQNQDFEVMEYC